jgi:predicted site-specific integrase-resolvase
MFTIQESADLLGLHPQTLRRARDAGRLQVIEVLGEERIRESELLRLTTPPVSFSRGRKGAVK